MGDNFKAHRADLGDKLGQLQALGPSGLARRIEEARAAERARVVAQREVGAVVERVKGEGLRKRGRPGLGKPWEALGVSRATYFSMKRAGELKGSGA